MSKWRLRLMAVAVTALVVTGRPQAQGQQIQDVLKLSAVYVAEFRKQLSGIVAEETYKQDIAYTARIGNKVGASRLLKSDLLLVMPADSDRHVELRDVFEVDGTPVRDRDSRVETLLKNPFQDTEGRLSSIIETSARYNIGSITRNVNTPLMALQFLDAAYQSRFQFKHIEKATPVFGAAQDQAVNETPVFRVSTEMWTIGYEEKQKPTIVRSPTGENRPAHGRFWVNPQNGSVLISEMIVDTGGVIATVTVSYQSEPLVGFMVPVEMRESYIRYGERISGRAEYGKFRQIQQ